MHLWLVAYDFPPIPSPQALRWAYLVRELAEAGHTVEVIAPDVPGYGAGGLPRLPSQVHIHRVQPGRLTRLLLGGKRAECAQETVSDCAVNAAQILEMAEVAHIQPGPAPLVAVQSSPNEPTQSGLNWKGHLRRQLEGALGVRDGLNWKGELAERVKSWMSRRMFPDYRAEWIPSATARLDELLALGRPDAIVVSHEPACSLPVGLHAARCGVPLVVDMGDPVLAPYTPQRWKELAFQLERDVCQAAVMVSVTTDAAAQVLKQRHELPDDRLLVIRQGFDPSFVASPAEHQLMFDPARLEVLYTGSFYSFRSAEALLDAVVSVPGVRLTVATISAPPYLVDAARQHPDSFRLVGFLPHRVALAAQRDCDVLLNIANADPVQVPGKVFEYLGAAKPILHLRGDQTDATGELLAGLRAGREIPAVHEVIAAHLAELVEMHRSGRLATLVQDRMDVGAYGWPSLAAAWVQSLQARLVEPVQFSEPGRACHVTGG